MADFCRSSRLGLLDLNSRDEAHWPKAYEQAHQPQRGQTPAKQVLHMRTVSLRTGTKASWGRVFVREWIAKPVMGFLAAFTLGIAYFWLVWDGRNQELWDKMVGTVVVNDANHQLIIQRGPAGAST
jgi:uncharacterized RDD family membrane protein YckC